MAKTKMDLGLLIGLVLMIIFAIALSSTVYVLACVEYVNTNGDMVLKYDNLKRVMADDVFYLSQDFVIENGLETVPILGYSYYENDNNINEDIYYFGDVVLEYDTNKVGSNLFMREELKKIDFNSRVKNIDLYRYELISACEEGIPVRVSVVGAPKVNKKHKYNQSYGNVKYAVLDSKLTKYYKGIGKSYEIKAQVGKVGLIKKFARLKITVTVDAEYVNDYATEQIEERVDSMLKSSLNYVEFYK